MLLDEGGGADVVGDGGAADLGAVLDQDHAEDAAALKQLADHGLVALLENLERQLVPGEEHGAQREQRNLKAGHEGSVPATGGAEEGGGGLAPRLDRGLGLRTQ